MALLFDDATPDFLLLSSTAVTAVPLTLGCWFRSDDVTIRQTMLSVCHNLTATAAWSLQCRGDVAGDPIEANCGASGANSGSQSSSGYSAGTWYQATGVFTSATSRLIYFDGVAGTADTTNRTPTGIDSIEVGRRDNVSAVRAFSGDVCEAAVWNRVLSAAEIASLAAGYSPLFLPRGLVFYCPLVRDVVNFNSGGNPAATGTTVSDHPRIIYPSRPKIGLFHHDAAAVAAPRLALLGCGA